MTTNRSQFSVSVAGAVVDDQGRCLIIRRADNGHWEPPGGVLEPDETITDCLRREVREETGLDVEPVVLSGTYHNLPRHIVALVFRCKATGGDLTATDETSGFRWATPAEIKTLMHEAYAIRVLDALEYSGHPAIRSHDGVHLI
jgi:ADP-ribose pyrophosphatase YjhB (NUDIX family)